MIRSLSLSISFDVGDLNSCHFRKSDAAQEPDPGIHKIRISIVSESLGFACA
jgi:hypothetical protein